MSDLGADIGADLGAVVVAHHERFVAVGPDVVVKVDRDLAGHRREAGALALLAAGGVPAPAVVAAQEVDDPPCGVLVLERVAGDPLGEHGEEDARFGAETWAAVGAALARFHACPVAPPGPPMAGHAAGSFAAHVRAWGAHDRAHGRRHGWLDGPDADRHDALVGALADRLDGRPEVLVHGDCSPQHWLVAAPGGPVRPIDLGDTGMGDPGYDLVVLTLTQPHRWDAVLDGYGADAALRAHLDAAAPALRALRLAGEVAWLLDHAFDPTPALARLRTALAAPP
jgi:aminoglycoside phosphotransferase (APT) family kinase protein